MNEESLASEAELDFTVTIKELKVIFEGKRNIILATSLDNRVTARNVQYISDDLDIYFTSWEFNKKIIQIKGNSNVALNLHDIQIEGTAEIFNWPLNEKLLKIEDKFAAKYKWFNQISESREAVLVKITPKKIVKFKVIDRIFHLQNIDLENKKVYQMKLTDKQHPNYPY
ncbi:MAG: pyridoxamine 5'-phosphate oxidase family protein [Candidatus Heimdallarchaeota archaeon]